MIWAIALESVEVFLAATALVLLLELGDKTQLATIALASRTPWLPVLFGASLGLIAVTAIGAAVGGLLAAFFESWLVAIQIGGGVLFIAVGLWTYLKPPEEIPAGAGRSPLLAAFGLAFLAELGDKTQLAVIVLSATYAAPLSVFAGASVALVVIAATSVLIGSVFARFLRREWLRVVSTILFIGAGVLLILDAIL